jgi:hypothetical protein
MGNGLRLKDKLGNFGTIYGSSPIRGFMLSTSSTKGLAKGETEVL